MEPLSKLKVEVFVVIHSKQGTKFIYDVLYIPDLDQNLLSVAQIIKNRYLLFFKRDMCVVYDPLDFELVRVKMVNNNFPIKWDNDHAYSAKVDESFI